MCFLISLTLFHKHDTANWIYAIIHARNHIEANELPDMSNIFQEKNNFFMHRHIDSVASVMFVEISSRHQETHAKKH